MDCVSHTRQQATLRRQPVTAARNRNQKSKLMIDRAERCDSRQGAVDRETVLTCRERREREMNDKTIATAEKLILNSTIAASGAQPIDNSERRKTQY